MTTQNIIMQVSEETEKIMEHITDELNEEADARFDEVIELLEELQTKLSESSLELLSKSKNLSEQSSQNKSELVQKLIEISELISNYKKDLHHESDDLSKKLSSVSQEISSLSGDFKNETIILKDITSTLTKCTTYLEEIKAGVNKSQENHKNESEKLLSELECIYKKAETTSQILNSSMDKLFPILENLSESVNQLTEQQATLKKDVDFLKLPFFKRLFTKG